MSFHGPVNSGEAGGHRSKPEVVLALFDVVTTDLFNPFTSVVMSEN